MRKSILAEGRACPEAEENNLERPARLYSPYPHFTDEGLKSKELHSKSGSELRLLTQNLVL